MLRLAFASLWNRRAAAVLTLASIGISVALVLCVESLRRDTRSAFANTVSGVDLVVGARSGSVQLLLYSVFRLGNATNNISWASYDAFRRDPDVAWTIPFSLGDSHRGYRVLGTEHSYFEHFRYASKRALKFSYGSEFENPLDAVLGAEVAAQLEYRLGDTIVLSHGAGDVSFIQHDDKPFTVVGVLERTGTPVDRTVHISLAGMEAIHEGWKDGAPPSGRALTFGQTSSEPEAITAFLVGLKSRMSVFRVQRRVNEYRREPLLAILPGVALQELWDVMRIAEDALRVVAGMVVLTGIAGMMVVVLSSLEARRREMAILRSVGAGPSRIFGLFLLEATLLTLGGVVAGLVLRFVVVTAARPLAQSMLGVELAVGLPTANELGILAAIVAGGLVAGAIPAWRASRMSLSDGLSMRI